MPIQRRFIDLTSPALPAIVRALVEETASGGFADLSNTIIVTPGARAGRRFLELLAEVTSGRNAPPRTMTPSQLPESLYEPKHLFANDLTQQLVWVEALRSLALSSIRKLVGTPPDDADLTGWLALGRMLAGLHRELAADHVDFADVASSPLVFEAAEAERWQTLRDIQQEYLRRLDALELWDLQTARRVAIAHHECRTDARIVLVGAVDMTITLRHMLEQVADRVTAFIHAPESMAALFDEFGLLRAAQWRDRSVDLPDSILQTVDGPDDQAQAVVDAVAILSGRRRADEIIIGVADERLASPVRSALHDQGVATRWVGEKTVADSAPFKLLTAIAERLEDDRTAKTTTLVRHPDVSRWLDRKLPPNWLMLLDRHVANRIPRKLSASSEATIPQRMASLIEQWLAPFAAEPRALGEWLEPMAGVLETIYGDRLFDLENEDDRHCDLAFKHILKSFESFAAIPPGLAPSATAAAAIRLALESVAGEVLPPESDPGAVELVGWLELPLDDAPALIVCGFNEDFVPSSLNADQFLPNRLREQLGLQDNARRYARDAYATSALRHSHKSILLISGRRDGSGDPLLPSRLLFATDPETIARRVLRIVKTSSPRTAPAAVAADRSFGFKVPRPVAQPTPAASIRVTAFRDYLACRYRYYLRHIEKLEAVDDRLEELDARIYGTLIHEILNQWVSSPSRRSTDQAEILSDLNRLMTGVVAEKLEPDLLPAVRLQLEQARLRLSGFARWQAGWNAEGWEIWKVEESIEHDLRLPSGRSITIKGRIDRIDHHRDSDRWAILDYKTGDSADNSPQTSHRHGDQWIDLQLPLYRRLAAELQLPSNVEVGYVLLPRTPSKVKEYLANWSEEEFQSADDEILRIAEHILDGDFWTPGSEPPRFDDFASICMEGVFGREAFHE